MQESISKKIEEYVKANPLVSEGEVRATFKVSRQLVNQIFHEIFTNEELEVRRHQLLNVHSEEIKNYLTAEKSINEISKLLDIGKYKLIRIINSNPELKAIVDKQNDDHANEYKQISADWLADCSIETLMKKYWLGSTAVAATSYISRLRSKYGTEMFPYRIGNQVELSQKIKQHAELAAEGKTDNEIYQILGYKTLGSMRASFSTAKKDEGT